jgi:hypothetical protein
LYAPTSNLASYFSLIQIDITMYPLIYQTPVVAFKKLACGMHREVVIMVTISSTWWA